jgi:hypothetical protein
MMYFHRRVTVRAKKNHIKRLAKPDGQIIRDKKVMHGMVTDFFKTLYMADPEVSPEEVVNLLQLLTFRDMNESLCKDFSEEEISDVLFQIGPLKASGPDGFLARFFQHNWDVWDVVKMDVIRAVWNFFDTGQMPPGVNDTTIVLIPKKDEPELLKDFRPISLCNVIYKVVSKCLVNRLRPILHELIGPMHSAFVSG